MKHRMLAMMMPAIILATLPLTSHSASFHISWTGANGYSMMGMFSYSDSLINTGLIDSSHLDNFTIEGFLNGTTLGFFQLGPSSINFNFDTKSQTFVTGGTSDSASGQRWNVPTTDGGFGFFSGDSTQGIYSKGNFVSDSQIQIGSKVNFLGIVSSTLTATPLSTTEMPEPSTMVLLGTGLIGFLVSAWCRQSKKEEDKLQNNSV